jgi:hypothetical protein
VIPSPVDLPLKAIVRIRIPLKRPEKEEGEGENLQDDDGKV